MSAIISSSALERKARQARSKARPMALPLAALAVAFIPGIHGDRVEALPPSVVKTVTQAQYQSPAPMMAAPVSASEAAARRALDARIRSLGQSFDGDVGIAVKDLQSGFTSHFDGASHFPSKASASSGWR
jgi:beta-lactamase class A